LADLNEGVFVKFIKKSFLEIVCDEAGHAAGVPVQRGHPGVHVLNIGFFVAEGETK
jgi:hypothetical protein